MYVCMNVCMYACMSVYRSRCQGRCGLPFRSLGSALSARPVQRAAAWGRAEDRSFCFLNCHLAATTSNSARRGSAAVFELVDDDF